MRRNPTDYFAFAVFWAALGALMFMACLALISLLSIGLA